MNPKDKDKKWILKNKAYWCLYCNVAFRKEIIKQHTKLCLKELSLEWDNYYLNTNKNETKTNKRKIS